jgi:hypothetical protein
MPAKRTKRRTVAVNLTLRTVGATRFREIVEVVNLLLDQLPAEVRLSLYAVAQSTDPVARALLLETELRPSRRGGAFVQHVRPGALLRHAFRLLKGLSPDPKDERTRTLIASAWAAFERKNSTPPASSRRPRLPTSGDGRRAGAVRTPATTPARSPRLRACDVKRAGLMAPGRRRAIAGRYSKGRA